MAACAADFAFSDADAPTADTGEAAKRPRRRRRIAALMGATGAAAGGAVLPAMPAQAAGTLSHWVATPNGAVTALDGAPSFGSLPSAPNLPVVGLTPTRDAKGYWLVASDGGVFTFGDAQFYGSTGNIRLNQPINGMAPTPDGHGYWLVASDGGIFTFGDAGFHGSTGNLRLVAPIAGMAPTTDGQGYWLVGADGGVFTGGDAGFYGRGTGSATVPVDGIVASPDSQGYWLLDNDGSVQAFGSAGTTALSVSANGTVPSGGVVKRDTAGAIAVAFAMAQLGKPYGWGATGPYAYDCSGLTFAAWQAAGVTLPRVAADQYNAGLHVPVSAAEPGDLIFYASNPSDPSTIYHVGIYIGNGQIVNATVPGSTVMVLNIGDISGLVPLATRP